MSTEELLNQRYKKSFLNKKEVAHELGISEPTLNRRMANLSGVPFFIKEEKLVKFKVKDVARFIDNSQTIKTHF